MIVQQVIMAGGVGNRLWPLSRRSYPKQFIKIFGKLSLLQQTILRNTATNPIVLTNQLYRFLVAEHLREIDCQAEIILEPESKNTACCALLAATIGRQRSYDCIVLFPADHYIQEQSAYEQAIAEGIQAAVNSNNIITIGIKPSIPHTGYGYLQAVPEVGSLFAVKKFIEKPKLEDAKHYLASQQYWWNSGIYIFRPEVMIELAKALQPQMLVQVDNCWIKSKKDLDFIRLDSESFQEIAADSIDYALMEKSANIKMISGDFNWNDIGSWNSVAKLSDKDLNNNTLSQDVIAHNVHNCYISGGKRLIAAINLQNLIIVDTEDALLVSSHEVGEEIKILVQELVKKDKQEAENHVICYRPWGSYQTVDKGELHQVKRIMVYPGQKLSLQFHNHRAEHWVVVRGKARVEVGDQVLHLEENDSIYIPKGAKHRLANIGTIDLHLIEVQTGHYLGEDDIVRLSDLYGRV